MNKKLNFVFLILVILNTTIICDIHSQVTLNLKIKQSIVEPEYLFKIKNLKFVIIKRKYNFKRKDSGLKERRIFSKKLKDEELEELNRLVVKLLPLKSSYSEAALGGIRWDIYVRVDKREKKIKIENMAVNEINSLFESINKLIPSNKPKITIIRSRK